MATAKKQAIPRTALILGLAGLIPFVTSAIATVIASEELALKATQTLGAYGAVILSFLGGVKWGLLVNDKPALKSWKPISLSVVPSIVAWIALLFPPMVMLSILAAGLVFQYYLDTESVRLKKLPQWYGNLRLILTTGAVLSLLAGLVGMVL